MNTNLILSKLPLVPGVISGFKSRHPRVVDFISGFKKNPIQQGAIVEIAVTNPDGSKFKTNMRVSAEDLNAFYAFMK